MARQSSDNLARLRREPNKMNFVLVGLSCSRREAYEFASCTWLSHVKSGDAAYTCWPERLQVLRHLIATSKESQFPKLCLSIHWRNVWCGIAGVAIKDEGFEHFKT